MPTEKPRFSITIPDEVLKRVEEYQKAHGISTRNKAVRELVKKGFALIAEQGKKEKAAVSGGLREDEAELLSLYNSMNAEGQRRVMDYAEDLADTGKYIKNSAIPAEA